MASYRIGRINEEMAKELAVILRTVKDPRVSATFITVTSVDCTPDLKYAKIYYSFMGGDDPKEIARGLKSATPYIRGQISSRLNLRITPELKFIYDDSLAYGAGITKLIHQVEKELAESDAKAEAEAMAEADRADGESEDNV